MDTSFNYNSILKMHDYCRTRRNANFNLSELINMLSSQDIAELHKIIENSGKNEGNLCADYTVKKQK